MLTLNQSIFKAYDIRGVVGKTLDASIARQIGQAFGSAVRKKGERTVVIGKDGRLSGPEQERLGALVFSAKEAFYKCQYGLTESWVGFHDVMLDPAACDWDNGRFAVLPLKPLQLERQLPPPWSGSFRFEDSLVVSGMAFAAP